MIISSIKKDKKHLMRIESDDGNTFYIDCDLFSEISLSVGCSLEKCQVEELLKKSDYYRAKSKALWYLDRADHTKKALYDKLVRSNFSKENCAKVIERLSEPDLLDDVRYANRYSERLSDNNISSREIYMKLITKGVPKDIAKDTVDALEVDECSQIRAVIDKKYKNKLGDKQSIQKVYSALARKGFSFSAVRDVLKDYCEELRYISED